MAGPGAACAKRPAHTLPIATPCFAHFTRPAHAVFNILPRFTFSHSHCPHLASHHFHTICPRCCINGPQALLHGASSPGVRASLRVEFAPSQQRARCARPRCFISEPQKTRGMAPSPSPCAGATGYTPRHRVFSRLSNTSPSTSVIYLGGGSARGVYTQGEGQHVAVDVGNLPWGAAAREDCAPRGRVRSPWAAPLMCQVSLRARRHRQLRVCSTATLLERESRL